MREYDKRIFAVFNV